MDFKWHNTYVVSAYINEFEFVAEHVSLLPI